MPVGGEWGKQFGHRPPAVQSGQKIRQPLFQAGPRQGVTIVLTGHQADRVRPCQDGEGQR